MKSFLVLLTAFVYAFQLGGCKHSSNNEPTVLVQDTTVYTAENYSAVTLDSFFLQNFLAQDTTLQIFSKDISAFYTRRNYQAAWFAGDSLSGQAKVF